MRTHDPIKSTPPFASDHFRQSQSVHQRTLEVPFALALRRFVAPLEFRPMLWMACCAMLGVALGGAYALLLCKGDLMSLSRSDFRLLLPFVLTIVTGLRAFELRRHALFWRVCLGLCLIFAFAFTSARRMAPPANDISRLANLNYSLPMRSIGPIKPQFIEARGIVADFPKRGEFGTQFPLDCAEPNEGRVWVHAKANEHIRVGDEISLTMQLLPLARPSNPGQRTSYWSLIGNGCWSEGRRVIKLVVLQPAKAMPVERGVDSARNAILARYQSLFRGEETQQDLNNRPFPGAMAQIVTAMVFGEGGLAQPLPRQTRDDFRVAGLSHLLVASGTQAALLAMTLLFVLSKISLRPAMILAVALPILLFYALIAGSAPSIWRATIIALLVLMALHFGRQSDGLSLWGAAILLLLAVEPLLAWSLSFQLTFAATWGLLVLAPAILRLWHFEKRGTLAQCLSFTLGAQAATIPISLVHFGSMSIAGIGANFLALPIAAGLIYLGVAGLISGFMAGPTYLLSRLIIDVAHGAANLYGANWQGRPVGNWTTITLYTLFMLAMLPSAEGFAALARKMWVESIKRVHRTNWWPVLGLGVVFISLSAWRKLNPATGDMRVVVLDVGQGSATLFISPQNRAVLFSGGSDDNRTGVAGSVILPALQNLGIGRLEAIVLCEPNAKNNSALPSVLREVPVGMVLDATTFANGIASPKLKATPDLQDLAFPEYRATLREAARQKISVVSVRHNQELRIDGAKIRFISAPRQASPSRFGFSCDYGSNRVFIAGNLNTESQERLSWRRDLNSDLLVVGNNGINGSVTRELLKATTPAAALIAVGRYNREKAPAAVTLRRLDSAKTQIFRTDFDGSLTASCDGKRCRVTPSFEWGEPN